MRKIFLLSVILYTVIHVWAQDVITLKNGDEIEALVQKIGEMEVAYKKWDFQDGPTFTIMKSEIFRIKYQNGTKDVFNDFTESVKPQVEQINYIPDNVPHQPRHPAEPEMVFVEGGTFTMGDTDDKRVPKDERLVHQVTLSSFYIGKYVVTQEQWIAVMGSNSRRFKGRSLPVTDVSFNDVYEFIKRLNAATGKNYRLPTEAEWEFAARGGTANSFCPGGCKKYSGSNNANDVAWYANNSHGHVQPVGTKIPNELGIYDMSGNVWEWCQDCYNFKCSSHVLRGGIYNQWASTCQLSKRHYADYAGYDHGFRLVLDP
jgi:formylglycine-generating enzyme required for sulfatase activity